MELLHLASPLAGQWYTVLAVAGMWAGTGVFVLQSMWLNKLARKLREKCLSTSNVAIN
jgi:hypothetical protein